MSTTFSLSFDVTPTDASAGLGIELWWDNTLIQNIDTVTESMHVQAQLPDDDQQHDIRLIMKNKLSEHTQLDAQGHIEKDACLIIENFSLDDIQLGYLLTEKSRYEHNTNGTTDPGNHQFFGTMGCNGAVILSIQTPIYLWLLENL